MYAILETGGKQYKVSEGDVIFIEKLNLQDGDPVKFDKILAVSNEGEVNVGTPLLDGAAVEATVVKSGKGKKIRVFKYKPKKGYHKMQGHRQAYTKVQIDKILA